MTTAARPTYYAAIGKQDYGGFKSRAVCAKDQAAHTRLKFRQVGQSTQEEVKSSDLRNDLDRKEQEYASQKNKAITMILQEEKKIDVPLLLKNKPEIDEEVLKKYDDDDIDQSDDGFDSSSDESDDEDDDEAELQAELQRIKEEREQAAARKVQEEAELELRMNRENAMKNNPLALIEENSAKIKRRWNDDVVFRNQTRDEPEQKKRFINDTIRSDFHRSFIKKFMK
eukprot:CAMPEP_0184972788 /NCGR_PEP_ID=MMETSP1098-20130426/4749_1 /TAXON_ID=89044 /ORGANISM="Spumella elongata, Strain CCAP 955/1" /LENGTH=226 /DNA_ID=CAMNT_0027495161 /DNA_START=41 /DNA_END=721 /DNA_ORIENTATION=-